MTDTTVPVTQADREAAAQLIEAYWSGSDASMLKLAQSYRDGHSQGVFVRAFARHRLAAVQSRASTPAVRRTRVKCDKPDCDWADGRAILAFHEGDREALRQEVINTPETAGFMAGVPLEAAHQRERWGVDHDAGKSPFDWFWLVGYLAQKAASSAVAGDSEKAMHHTISTAAALANWHAALSGADTAMRPGIADPEAR